MNATDRDALDAQDMARLASGHDTALKDLMERHGERLFHYLVRSLQDESDAADLAQESFVKVYQHRDRFDPNQKFSTWLYAIASNLVRDRFRWRKRHAQISLESQNEETGTEFGNRLPADSISPSQSLETIERAEAVRRAVGALPEDLRTPLILAEYEERSQAEIGAILGCTAKAVETRIYRARRRLREALATLIQEV